MALPKHLYANLALVPDAPVVAVKKGPIAVERPRIDAEREAEAYIKRKVEQANRVLDKLEARQQIMAAYIKELQRRKAALCARAERMEDRIIEEMQAAGMNNVAGIRTALRIQPAAEALDVFDEQKLPKEYLKASKVTYSPDKVAIKSAIAKMEDFSPSEWGCRLTSKISLIRT